MKRIGPLNEKEQYAWDEINKYRERNPGVAIKAIADELGVKFHHYYSAKEKLGIPPAKTRVKRAYNKRTPTVVTIPVDESSGDNVAILYGNPRQVSNALKELMRG